jgi:hypothetical protein
VVSVYLLKQDLSRVAAAQNAANQRDSLAGRKLIA